MAALPEASIDAIVTDPPYGLEFMGKEWDRLGAPDGFRRVENPADAGRQSVHGRLSRKGPEYTTGAGKITKPGIGERETPWPSNRGWNEFRCRKCGHLMHGGSPCACPEPDPARQDDRWNQMQAWHEAWARAAYRVLKPGGHLLAFGGSRTYHRLACAIEDAGFEVRDCLMWLYGSGFPKSLDVSKAIDKAAGAEREVLEVGQPVKRMIPGADQNKVGWEKNNGREFVPTVTTPATAKAAQWSGWGTALKPAHEPIILARKPLAEKNVAVNVLKHGIGAINVDGCRIETTLSEPHPPARWPANVLLDEEAARLLDEQSGTLKSGILKAGTQRSGPEATRGGYMGRFPVEATRVDRGGDTGGASRFFYTAKADKDDRDGSKHPTVKPADLMKWLIRLVTPPDGVVLDPFLGSGTTVYAARSLGIKSIGIERDEDYVQDAIWRLRQGQLL